MRRLLFVFTLAICIAQPANEKATAVADVLRTANLFPKSAQITDTTAALTGEDKKEGAVSSANIAAVTVKVYQSLTQRHRARLRMVKECPGCNAIAECGAILVHTRYTKVKDLNEILAGRSGEYLTVLSRRYRCK